VPVDAHELQRLRTERSLVGAMPGMLELLALHGSRALALRLDRAQASADELAAQLCAHAAVMSVRYPGFGTIVSFELADADAADRVCGATRTVRHATSLGGIDTTMDRRGVHPGQEQIPPGLIRMSTACEDLEDIWDDLGRAVGAA
jgi:cystathionine gamma-synthase